MGYRMVRTVCVLGVALAAGCATLGGGLEGARDSWRGVEHAEVVRSWGAPTRSTTLADGRAAHTWVSDGTVATGSVWPSIGIYGGTGGVGIGTGVTVSPGSQPARCERTLFFRDGRVVE
jgi:hypothetical protein